MKRVMLRMGHGLGDNVQLSIVLKHLKEYYHPEWHITVETKWPTLFAGLCDEVKLLAPNYMHTKWDYDESFYLAWASPEKTYQGLPSTKVTRCLFDEFKVSPLMEYYRYTVNTTPEHKQRAADYVAGRDIMLLHYEGVSQRTRKNLSHHQADVICNMADANGYTPVVVDFQKSSPLDYEHLPLDFGHDPALVKAVIDEACHVIAIDSSVGHLAGASETPTTIIWVDMWPGHNFDPAPNVEHWFDSKCKNWIKNDRDLQLMQFNNMYHSLEYGLDTTLALWFQTLGKEAYNDGPAMLTEYE